MRNSLLLAPMPTASTAQILGNNESIEPYTSNIYSRRVLSGEFQVSILIQLACRDGTVVPESLVYQIKTIVVKQNKLNYATYLAYFKSRVMGTHGEDKKLK